jgi:hypothetical protein
MEDEEMRQDWCRGFDVCGTDQRGPNVVLDKLEVAKVVGITSVTPHVRRIGRTLLGVYRQTTRIHGFRAGVRGYRRQTRRVVALWLRYHRPSGRYHRWQTNILIRVLRDVGRGNRGGWDWLDKRPGPFL